MDVLQLVQARDILFSAPSSLAPGRSPAPVPRHVCFSSRRHRRRRLKGMEPTTRRGFLPSRLEDMEDDVDVDDDDGFYGNGLQRNRPSSDGQNLVITFDLKAIRSRAEALRQASLEALRRSRVRATDVGRRIVEESKDFVEDIRSSVSINRDHRLVISIRRSSLDFALNAILWSAFIVVMWKVWARFSKQYRWGWEEDGFHSQGVYRRDRSLGGREVFVGNWFFNRKPKPKEAIDSGSLSLTSRRPKTEISESGSLRRRINPLDSLDISRSEKEMVKPVQSKASKPLEKSLPGWWPPSTPRTLTSERPSNGAGDEVSLIRVITEKRLSGKDFEKDDIFELRRICRNSGSRVSFGTMYLRDSFYRATINMVLASCGRSGNSQMEILDENPVEFLVGLAENISLEAERAAVMVNAAVAARTRSTFLQSWALYAQDKLTEAKEEITQLCRIHATFPPDKNSPEMEMVGQGLARHLAFDERKQLLAMYVNAGGTSLQRIGSEALGLSSTRK